MIGKSHWSMRSMWSECITIWCISILSTRSDCLPHIAHVATCRHILPARSECITACCIDLCDPYGQYVSAYVAHVVIVYHNILPVCITIYCSRSECMHSPGCHAYCYRDGSYVVCAHMRHCHIMTAWVWLLRCVPPRSVPILLIRYYRIDCSIIIYPMHLLGSIDTIWSAFRASGKPSTCQRIVWMGQVQWHTVTKPPYRGIWCPRIYRYALHPY